jgi:hypothetical protein
MWTRITPRRAARSVLVGCAVGLVVLTSACTPPRGAMRTVPAGPSAPVLGGPYCPKCELPPAGVGITWQAPSDGGSTITEYRVIVETQGVGTSDQTLTMDQLVVEPLGIHWSFGTGQKDPNFYRAQVAAINSKGQGPFSAFSDWYTRSP